MDSLTEGTTAVELAGLALEEQLGKLASITAWTSGAWKLSPDDERRWNGLQNTPNDVRLLTNFLIRALRSKSP